MYILMLFFTSAPRFKKAPAMQVKSFSNAKIVWGRIPAAWRHVDIHEEESMVRLVFFTLGYETHRLDKKNPKQGEVVKLYR